jgi:hypothetical protein
LEGCDRREEALKSLIVLAERTRLLREIDVHKARQIQRAGNTAIHSAGAGRREALVQIQRTVDV